MNFFSEVFYFLCKLSDKDMFSRREFFLIHKHILIFIQHKKILKEFSFEIR
jgi:hypothetical protein